MNAKRDKTKINDEEKDNQSNDNKDHQINIEADSDKLEVNTNEREAQELSKEDELIEEITSLKEEKIRLLAEMENIRKRFERDKSESILLEIFFHPEIILKGHCQPLLKMRNTLNL